jgi:hypothetical protein
MPAIRDIETQTRCSLRHHHVRPVCLCIGLCLRSAMLLVQALEIGAAAASIPCWHLHP